MHTSINDLKDLQTITTFNVLEQLREDFKTEKRNLNIKLLDYLQYEYSSKLQIDGDLHTSYFEVRVYCSHWSEYRQEKLDKLENLLRDCCRSVEVMSEFIPEDSEYKQIFKVIFNHA